MCGTRPLSARPPTVRPFPWTADVPAHTPGAVEVDPPRAPDPGARGVSGFLLRRPSGGGHPGRPPRVARLGVPGGLRPAAHRAVDGGGDGAGAGRHGTGVGRDGRPGRRPGPRRAAACKRRGGLGRACAGTGDRVPPRRFGPGGRHPGGWPGRGGPLGRRWRRRGDPGGRRRAGEALADLAPDAGRRDPGLSPPGSHRLRLHRHARVRDRARGLAGGRRCAGRPGADPARGLPEPHGRDGAGGGTDGGVPRRSLAVAHGDAGRARARAPGARAHGARRRCGAGAAARPGARGPRGHQGADHGGDRRGRGGLRGVGAAGRGGVRDGAGGVPGDGGGLRRAAARHRSALQADAGADRRIAADDPGERAAGAGDDVVARGAHQVHAGRAAQPQARGPGPRDRAARGGDRAGSRVRRRLSRPGHHPRQPGRRPRAGAGRHAQGLRVPAPAHGAGAQRHHRALPPARDRRQRPGHSGVPGDAGSAPRPYAHAQQPGGDLRQSWRLRAGGGAVRTGRRHRFREHRVPAQQHGGCAVQPGQDRGGARVAGTLRASVPRPADIPHPSLQHCFRAPRLRPGGGGGARGARGRVPIPSRRS